MANVGPAGNRPIDRDRCRENGGQEGFPVLVSYYVHEVSWQSFTPAQRRTITKARRGFTQALQEEGFIEA